MFNSSVGLTEAELTLISHALNYAAVQANSKDEKEKLEQILDIGFKIVAELNNLKRLNSKVGA